MMWKCLWRQICFHPFHTTEIFPFPLELPKNQRFPHVFRNIKRHHRHKGVNEKLNITTRLILQYQRRLTSQAAAHSCNTWTEHFLQQFYILCCNVAQPYAQHIYRNNTIQNNNDEALDNCIKKSQEISEYSVWFKFSSP